jgi:hypothetical protein
MSKILSEVLTANGDYAESFGEKANLALPPARQFAILTCMDARLDPAKFAGLREGDAHVIRNAGGRASDDAIRSLVLARDRDPMRASLSTGSPLKTRRAVWFRTFPASVIIRWFRVPYPCMAMCSMFVRGS